MLSLSLMTMNKNGLSDIEATEFVPKMMLVLQLVANLVFLTIVFGIV